MAVLPVLTPVSATIQLYRSVQGPMAGTRTPCQHRVKRKPKPSPFRGRAFAGLVGGDAVEFLVGTGKLGLGQMAYLLREARTGKGELFGPFGDRTRQHFPKLDGSQVDALKEIYMPRTVESHESASVDVTEVPKLCRGFIDALLA